MDKIYKNLLIVDGSYMMHRAGHTPAFQELVTSKGMKSGMMYGFMKILNYEMYQDSTMGFPVVCWDAGLSNRRVSVYPEYKANRHHDGDSEDEYIQEYRRQRSDVISALSKMGIPSVIIKGWEGDDLIKILTMMSSHSVVLSDDKDMVQLVSESVTLRRPMQKETLLFDSISDDLRHPRYTITKSIVGDPSDNIPQVSAGVGWKTADTVAEVIREYSLDEMKDKLIEYKNSCTKKSIKNKCESLINDWDKFIVNYKLINLDYVEDDVTDELLDEVKSQVLLGSSGVNMLECYKIFSDYEITSMSPDTMFAASLARKSNLYVGDNNG